MGVKLSAASGGSIEIVPTNTASNYTVTVPAATTTLVGTDTTQTLTGKTLTSATLTSATFTATPAVTTPQSMVRLNTTGIANGTTNTCICRFSTVVTNQGSDITYVDSAANGGSFTTNTNGVYAVSWSTGSNINFGISLNSTQLSTNIVSITAADRLVVSGCPAGIYATAAWTGYLPSGSVLRAHMDGGTQANAVGQFTIVRVS